MATRRTELQHILSPGIHVAALHAAREEDISYAEEVGYHIYGELRLGLRISAADDFRSARQHLGVLELFALAAEIAAAAEGAHVFEVQGERVHIFLPAAQDDQATVRRVLRFATAFNDLVYGDVAKKAGTAFRGFAQAACHGRTVVLRHGQGAGMSIISLSPAANAPAKRLGKDRDGSVLVEAKHLAIPTVSLRRAGIPVSSRGDWENVPLDPLPAIIASARDRTYIDGISSRLSAEMRVRQNLAGFQFGQLDERFYTTPASIEPGRAIQVSGFYLRADLSGFTHDVAAAFEQGGEAIARLVQRFTGILKHADGFTSRSAAPHLLRIPWAGDCANIGVLPQFGQSYQDAREFVPCDVPAEWHSHWKPGLQRAWLGGLLGRATWAASCAGGDVEDAGDAPVMLIATLRGMARNYLVASGWSVGRTGDALEIDGLVGGTTVLPEEDWKALEDHRQRLFKMLDTRFRVSIKLPDIDDIRRQLMESARQPRQVAVAGTSVVIPGARPYFNVYR